MVRPLLKIISPAITSDRHSSSLKWWARAAASRPVASQETCFPTKMTPRKDKFVELVKRTSLLHLNNKTYSSNLLKREVETISALNHSGYKRNKLSKGVA